MGCRGPRGRCLLTGWMVLDGDRNGARWEPFMLEVWVVTSRGPGACTHVCHIRTHAQDHVGLCVHACASLCAHMYAHWHAHTCVQLCVLVVYARVSVGLCEHTHASDTHVCVMHVHMCMCLCACMCVSATVCILCMCLSVCMCACLSIVHVCLCVHVGMHSHVGRKEVDLGLVL